MPKTFSGSTRLRHWTTHDNDCKMLHMCNCIHFSYISTPLQMRTATDFQDREDLFEYVESYLTFVKQECFGLEGLAVYQPKASTRSSIGTQIIVI